MNDFEKQIQDQINSYAIRRTYGVAILKNGSIVNIRTDFAELKELIVDYNFLQKTNPENFKEFMELTRGCFDNGEVNFQLDEVQVLINGERTEENNKAGANSINYPGFVADIMNLQIDSGQQYDDEEDD